MYDIETNEVQVYAYSTCGSVSAKITTPMQQSVLGLSLEQTLLMITLQFKTKDILLMKHFTFMTNL